MTTAVLLGVSFALDWRGQGRHVPYPVAVAHLTALATLLLPDTAAEMAGTWMLVGALTVAGGAWWRSHGRRTWAAAYALGGTAVLLVGLAVVGPGWDVVALVLGAVVAAVTAHLADGSGRVVAAATAAALTITAWLVALDRLDTPVLTGAAATCVLAGVATVGTAAGSRWLRVRDAVPAAVGSLSCAVVLAAAVLVTDLVLRPGDPELLAPAAGLGLAAAAAIRLATPTGWPWVREVAALLVVGAAGHLGAAVDASPAVAVVSASFIALLVALAGAVRWAAHPGSPWARPAIVGATGLLALAAVSAAGEPDLLAVVLLDATAVLAVIGLVGQRSNPLLVAPVPAVLGWWLLVVTHLPGAYPAWYAVPSGAAVLTFVAVLRWHRRAQGLDPAAAPVVVLDLLGMAVLVTPSLLASATSAVQAVLTVALGVTLGTYGVLSQVRRRVVVGAATVLLAVSAVVVPPLVGLLPRWEGPQLWLALLAAGLTALAAATMIERRRGGVRASVAALRALTASWE